MIAILLKEPEFDVFSEAIASASILLLSAASFLECSIVIEARLGKSGIEQLDRFVQDAQIQIISVTNEQIEYARQAYRQFGKGRHPVSLNFGDCFSYALAKAYDHPLLFKGNDFNQTDIAVYTG